MRTLFTPNEHDFGRFPSTRYLGSKRRSATWIVHQLADLEYRTVLDAFGGTGSVAYAFKCAGKAVTYNDALAFNHRVGRALIENHAVRLAPDDLALVLGDAAGVEYGSFIARTFAGVYFTDEENALLDRMAGNIRALDDPLKQALACFAVGQAALAKRPYNLFHRANLYLRLAEVERGFGNKSTWDRPFEDHVRDFAAQANGAVFDNGQRCTSLRKDALQLEGGFDLVYLDPPYVNARGPGVDYRDFYHFLEGFVQYDAWQKLIDSASRHRRLRHEPNPWCDATTIADCFRAAFERFRRAVIAVSYRSDGIPSVAELETMLHGVKRHVRVAWRDPKPYVLSKRRSTREVLLVGTD